MTMATGASSSSKTTISMAKEEPSSSSSRLRRMFTASSVLRRRFVDSGGTSHPMGVVVLAVVAAVNLYGVFSSLTSLTQTTVLIDPTLPTTTHVSPHSIEPQEQQNNVAVFIHIGKTGGSSARCILRRTLREQVCKTSKQYSQAALGDGNIAIRFKTIAVIHKSSLKISPSESYIYKDKEIKKNQTCKDTIGHDMTVGGFVRTHFQIAIVSVRNPIERIISWYLYTSRFSKHKGKDQILFGPDCNYQSIGQFSSDVSILASPNSTQCQKVARSCVLGEFECGYHNFYNYTYYLKDLFDDEGSRNLPSVQVFAIRNEYKWSDMEKSNLILGGTAQSFYAKALDDSIMLRRSKEDRSISNEARVILCTLLCQDMYYYAKVIHRAVNLHNIEKMESIKELSDSCSEEIDSICPAYDFKFRN